MHISYLGSIKENNIFLAPTTPYDIEGLIDHIKINIGVGPVIVERLKIRIFKTSLWHY